MLEQAICRVASVLPPVRRREGIPVLCYHGVYPRSSIPLGRFDIEDTTFQAHLAMAVADGRTVLSPADLHRAPADAILLTFDDNLPSHLSHAVPVLREFAASAIFFLSPGDLGAAGELSRSEVDALLAAGMFVGAHGNQHATAGTRRPTEFATDVRTCAAFLKSLGMPLTWSYPGGYVRSFDDVHERILLDHGFDLRFSTMEGVSVFTDRRNAQPRYVIRRDSSLGYVRAAMRGGLQLVSLFKRLRAVSR